MSTAEPTTTSRTGDRWYLASAPIWRALVHLAIPMMAATVVGAVYNVMNAGFLGSLHDVTLLSAITFGLPLLGLVMAVGGVFGVGGGAMVSRLMGLADRADAHPGAAVETKLRIRRTGAFVIWGSALGGLVVGGIALLLLAPLVRLLGADAASLDATTAYVGVMLAFTPVLTATFAIEQLVRAEGAAKASMIGLIASTVANLVLDVLFILVLHWGVAGAAAAIGISNLVALGYYSWYLRTHSDAIRLAPTWFRPDLAMVKEVFGVGVSELLMSGFLIVTALVMNNLAIGYGDGALAAIGVGVRIAQVPEFLVMGVVIGVLPLLAYSFGAGNRARLNHALRTSALWIGAIVLVFSGGVFLFREQVLEVFGSDHQLLATGVVVITAQLVATVFNGFTGLFTTLFQATGKAPAAMIMSIAQGVLFIPIVILGNLWFGLTGIIWAMTVTELLVLVAGAVLYLVYRESIARGASTGSESEAEAALAGMPG